MSLPLSQTRPKRASAAATADAIGRSLKEQDAAPDCDESAKKKRASEDDDEHVDAQTPAKRQSKAKAAKPSSKAALKAAPLGHSRFFPRVRRVPFGRDGSTAPSRHHRPAQPAAALALAASALAQPPARACASDRQSWS